MANERRQDRLHRICGACVSLQRQIEKHGDLFAAKLKIAAMAKSSPVMSGMFLASCIEDIVASTFPPGDWSTRLFPTGVETARKRRLAPLDP